MEELNEMLTFLTTETRLDLKTLGIQYVLGLTGSEDGKQLLLSQPKLLKCLIQLMHDSAPNVAKDACLCIVNLSSDESGSRMLISEECCSISKVGDVGEIGNVVACAISLIMDRDSLVADPACAVLSNVTRSLCTVERVLELMSVCDATIEKLVTAFTRIGYNKKDATLHYLGPVLSNLSQSPTVRKYLMNRQTCVIQRLLPFTEYKDSIIRRGGIVGTLRNCCFDTDQHMWLLGPEVDLLPRLLLPLAGPEEFDDSDTEKLPIELQYLPSEKTRESDPDIRRMLLEALLQLCATQEAREHMRKYNTYLILREFHKWEKDRKVLLACENVVDILIRTEDEIQQENLKNIEVPHDLCDKFQKIDEDFIKDV